jgi:YD repeat-containing protein
VGFGFDARGRLATVTQSNRQAVLSYDQNGFLAQTRDRSGALNAYTYDASGRVLTHTLSDGRSNKFTYDPNGNLASVTPPGSGTHVFGYSAVNLLTSYTPPAVAGAQPTVYAYDKDRELTSVTRPDGSTIAITYDGAGRDSSIVTPSGTVNYTYDANTGNLASEAIAGGESLSYAYTGPLLIQSVLAGTVSGSVARSFDNNTWIVAESVNGANTVVTSYDNDGLPTQAGSLLISTSPTSGLVTSTALGLTTRSENRSPTTHSMRAPRYTATP